MRFGGHETFHIRDGWLYKGLKLLHDNPGLYQSPDAADELGVGGNMAKSIRHWMLATRLAEKPISATAAPTASPVGKLILKRDPYFASPATWWALHINLVNNPEFAVTWDWFFNYSGQRRFEKGVALEQLKRFLHHQSNFRIPAQRTLERDFGVLLNSYSRAIPAEAHDPEDSKDCPFQELALIEFFRESGFYRINYGEKPIPHEVLGYCLSSAFGAESGDSETVTIGIGDAANAAGSPGKVFCLRGETVFDLALIAETALDDSCIRVTGLAGSRHIQFQALRPHQWLERYYQKEEANEKPWREQQQNLLKATS